MNKLQIKELLIRGLDKDSDPAQISKKLEEEGISFDFTRGFSEGVLEKISGGKSAVIRELEFSKNLRYVLYRIALPGVAAILLLLISIFIMEGSFSLNSILGIGDSYDESIVYLLTGI